MVADVPSSAALLHNPCVDQPTEVGTRGRRRNVCLHAVTRPVRAANKALLQRDHESIRPAVTLDKVFEETPARPCLFDLSETLSSLSEVGFDAKGDPAGGVSLGLVPTTLRLLEGGVIVQRVLA